MQQQGLGADVPASTTSSQPEAAQGRLGVQGGGQAGDLGLTGRGGVNTMTDMGARRAGGDVDVEGGIAPGGVKTARDMGGLEEGLRPGHAPEAGTHVGVMPGSPKPIGSFGAHDLDSGGAGAGMTGKQLESGFGGGAPGMRG